MRARPTYRHTGHSHYTIALTHTHVVVILYDCSHVLSLFLCSHLPTWHRPRSWRASRPPPLRPPTAEVSTRLRRRGGVRPCFVV